MNEQELREEFKRILMADDLVETVFNNFINHELSFNSEAVLSRGISDMDTHWHRIYGSSRTITFCKHREYWEFYLKNDDDVIYLLFALKVKGFGRASAIAKFLVRMSDYEFEVRRVSGIWRIK